ncbi:MAG: DUF1499 domain-containing protein [Balneolaceae bacterium]|nr:DUF1499 domain-containing protein [Balneolaceae bacterium]
MLKINIHLMLLVAAMSLFVACGSRSTDLESEDLSVNPLPECPDSPNCVRVTRAVDQPLETAWDAAVAGLNAMKPKEIDADPDLYRLEAVFVVVFFSDDLSIKLEKNPKKGTMLHLRSASRTGYSDLGVNRRRVNRFLSLFHRNLPDGT